MIPSIIFDRDGTLVDSSVIWATIPSDMLRDRGSIRTVTAGVAIPFHGMGGATRAPGFVHRHAEVGSGRSLLIRFDQFSDLAADVPIARRSYRARRCAA